jgi:APA family basic amino acid/polyamine antiporter|tara:strand:- start:2237 stop:3736 length:1500 start_codon:yes stop_codon:yes gene_type:complete
MKVSTDITLKTGLNREMGTLGLTATGICSMLGASIYVMPFMIQRNVPGIGPYVLPAFLLAAIPAILAAFAYSILASAMPRAGGSYIYASRGLNPYLGFVASFSQWFGLSIVIGVVSYVIVPFIRDIAFALDWQETAALLETGWVRVTLAGLLLWTFVIVNIQGTRLYERIVIPLMFLMFFLGAIVIIAGFFFTHEDFTAGLLAKEGRVHIPEVSGTFNIKTLITAAAVLFASFIGFDSIAQAGGEARNPSRSLPLAIALTMIVVGSFYILFTAAVYHAVPWTFVAQEAISKDITAPGMLNYILPSGVTIVIIAGAAIALINDLPAMLLAVSRLMFAWAEDGIFPKNVAYVHPRFHTPHIAILMSGGMASIGILGSHFAGDFFLGIDIMVTSMMVNFLLMCITLVMISRINPTLEREIKIIRNRSIQKVLGWAGILILSSFLIIHIWKDLSSDVEAWYYHSTTIWLIVMIIASIIFFKEFAILKKKGIDTDQVFNNLPPE